MGIAANSEGRCQALAWALQMHLRVLPNDEEREEYGEEARRRS